jgi:hypothetical protein
VIPKELMILASFNMMVPFVLVFRLFGVRMILSSDLKYLLVPVFAGLRVVPLSLFGDCHLQVGDDLPAADQNILTSLRWCII